MTNTSLVSLIYLSSATVPFNDSEIAALLEVSRRNNQASQISGILAYWDGNFIQYIEGPEAEIDRLVERIRRDRRHGGIIVLQRETVTARAFPHWSMAFDQAKQAPYAANPGVSDFLSDGFLEADPNAFSPSARILLEVFRKHVR